jgi:hypothetical protein
MIQNIESRRTAFSPTTQEAVLFPDRGTQASMEEVLDSRPIQPVSIEPRVSPISRDPKYRKAIVHAVKEIKERPFAQSSQGIHAIY